MAPDEFDMDAYVKREKEVVLPLADSLMEQDPGLSHISAYIMAKDAASQEYADKALADGQPWHKAAWVIGSYGRCDWVKRLVESGVIQHRDVFPHLLPLWRGSDPDDTDPFWLDMFKRAKREHKSMLFDGEHRPAWTLRQRPITVYRGQILDKPLGIAWTTNLDVAKAFGASGGTRSARPDGLVLTGKVYPWDVLAFITQRGEDEVVCDPKLVA